jgi:RsiW-degrading membrane proteinase PrsW (M82 family)
MILIIATALIPVLILGWWIYRKDSARPEPLNKLFQAFFYGVGSTFVTVVIVALLGFSGPVVRERGSFADAAKLSLFGAAFPEETAKLVLLWLFLRKCKDFDERMDGIVYAVCVGMGFAAFENLEYVIGAGSQWVTVGLSRSLTAIPGHFGFAVVMGYFFSLYYFDSYRAPLAGLKMWLYPVLLHGTYDWIAMSQQVNPELGGVIALAILLLCFSMLKWAQKHMKKHLIADSFIHTTGVDEQ